MHCLTAFRLLCACLAFSVLISHATAADSGAKSRAASSTARTPEAPPAHGFQVVAIRNRTGQQVGWYTASYALVIGASTYIHWPLLPGVQQDIQEVTAVLQVQGFQVELVRDPTRDALQRAFEGFIAQYGQQENHRLLIYFAGHGHTMKLAYGAEMGYLVPVDAPHPHRDTAGFLAQALDMHLIENYARRIQAKHVLFLFDSCFSGSVFSLSRAIPEYIQYKTSEPVRQFITSGSANEEVPDVSIFRQQLVAGLRGEADVDGDGYVTGAELGEFLQKRVVNYSKNTQHPQYGKLRDPYLDRGDFVFIVSKSPPPSPSPSVSVLQAQLAAERHRLEEERRRFEEQRRLQEEVQKLQAEQEQLRQEREKLQGTSSGTQVAVGVYPQPPQPQTSSPRVTQTLTYANGDVYVGETVNGKRQGEGVYTYKDGRSYTGAWQDDKRHGQGTMAFPNGDKYVGEFAEGLFHGQGTYTLSNGQQYTGTWKEGKQNGKGTLTYPNGDTYVGEWKDGRRDGQGTYTLHNGQQYIGAWQDDKRHGKGTWVFADGKKYVGEWRDDEQAGRGTMILPDGKQYTVEWKETPAGKVGGK
jgi:uncharacterized caspase-like protein